MAEELKACPFCGGEPNLTHSDYVHDDLRPMPVVECKSCSAWVRAEDWNTRAHLPSKGGEAVEVVGYGCEGQIEVLKHVPLTGGMKVSGREREKYNVPLMTVAQHERILAARVGSAEPVAWHTEDHLTDKSATTYDPEIAKRWRAKGWPVTPLYTHPQPPPGGCPCSH